MRLPCGSTNAVLINPAIGLHVTKVGAQCACCVTTPTRCSHPCNRDALNVPTLLSRALGMRARASRSFPPTHPGGRLPVPLPPPFPPHVKRSIRAQLPKATEGFGGGWMLAFCSRPKPLVMKNLTPYLYLTLGREGIGRTTLSNPLDLIICPDASRGDGE